MNIYQPFLGVTCWAAWDTRGMYLRTFSSRSTRIGSGCVGGGGLFASKVDCFAARGSGARQHPAALSRSF